MMESEQIGQIVEAALFAAEAPLGVNNLVKLFAKGELDAEEGRKQVRDVLDELQTQNATRGVELQRVASGYRYQVKQELSTWVGRLWDEKPPRYTRALLETLALIVYKQPVTRGDIEQIRGVSISQNIMRTLIERDWIRVVGQREVPGHPGLYGTTKAFLDYFNLKSLGELPPLDEIREFIEPMASEFDEVEVSERLATSNDADAANVDPRPTVEVELELVSEPASESQTAQVVQLHAGQDSNNPAT